MSTWHVEYSNRTRSNLVAGGDGGLGFAMIKTGAWLPRWLASSCANYGSWNAAPRERFAVYDYAHASRLGRDAVRSVYYQTVHSATLVDGRLGFGRVCLYPYSCVISGEGACDGALCCIKGAFFWS